MREDFWSFRPTHKLFLAANHKPTVRGTDHAIWRRIRLVPFTVTIEEDKKDPALLEKLLAERSGILRWAVEGCLEWQRMKGLRPPKEVIEATTSYRQEQDVVGEFLDDRCDIAPHFLVSTRDLLREYRGWCEHERASGDELEGARRPAHLRGASSAGRRTISAAGSDSRSAACDPTDVRAPDEPGDDEPKSFFEDV